MTEAIIHEDTCRKKLDGFEYPCTCQIKKKSSREKLAEYAHDAWSGWMKYLFNKCSLVQKDGTVIIPKWAVERWARQMEIKYSDLPEEEKNSDREEADRMINIFNERK